MAPFQTQFIVSLLFSLLLNSASISAATCSTISVKSDSEQSGRLESQDCRVSDFISTQDNSFVDVYEITVSSPGDFSFEMSSTDIDPFLRLLDNNKSTLVQDDDSGTGFNAKITAELSNGTYFLLANSATSATQTGTYALSIDFPDSTALASRLSNIATRAFVGTDEGVTIGGLIIEGDQPKTVVVRAIGPDLANRGVEGALMDPNLQLFSGADLIDSNDDWDQHVRSGEIPQNLVPQFQLEAVIVATLDPGPYTAIVRGNNASTGVGLIEIFEIASSGSKLVNIATRGAVGTGDNVMIGGIIISGEQPKTVLVRAVGPSLTDQGVPGALADPLLRIFSGPNLIETNDSWQAHARAAEIDASLQPANTAESAILITLEPGAYTAIVSGADGGTGVGLVEVFEIQ